MPVPQSAAGSFTEAESAKLLTQIDEICSSYHATNGWSAYSARSLTRAGARLYCQQHGIFTRHSRRAWAYVVGNCPELEVRRFIVRENLFEEEGTEELSHYMKLVRMGQALGLTREAIDDAVPAPSLRAALLIWETLTKDRHWLIGAASKAVLEMKGIAGVEGPRWMQRFGLSSSDCDFWMLHHEVDKVHGPGAFQLVLKYLPQYPEVDIAAILTAVEDSAYALRLFRDGVGLAAAALEERA
jgi:pyrroloquinoline quinone (PQQ) biosynthesis protein C